MSLAKRVYLWHIWNIKRKALKTHKTLKTENDAYERKMARTI